MTAKHVSMRAVVFPRHLNVLMPNILQRLRGYSFGRIHLDAMSQYKRAADKKPASPPARMRKHEFVHDISPRS